MLSDFINFDNAWSVALFTLINFLVIFCRYVLVSSIFQFVFTVLLKDQFKSRKISEALQKPGQSVKEIQWSAITSGIFTVSGVGLIWLFENDYTAIYTDFSEYGLWYIPLSIFIAMLIHEAYYYFLHRWMHRPTIFKKFHYVHHNSLVTSPWTAFSFHPIESVLQALIIPIILIFIPMHFAAILFLLTLMTITATINHLHIEIYPKGFTKNWFGKWWIGASHHSLHHSKYSFNYGLYFTFMDKWFGTESPDYMPLFEKKTKG